VFSRTVLMTTLAIFLGLLVVTIVLWAMHDSEKAVAQERELPMQMQEIGRSSTFVTYKCWFEGHEYILAERTNGGVTLIPSESCPCKLTPP
jgi:hypothetical protein